MASSSATDEALAARGLGYAWPGAASPCLRDVDLALRPGECVALAGRSGSGKTTLLRALAGVLPREGAWRGRVTRPAGGAALLFQDVESQLLCTTAGEEVGFGLALRGAPGDERARRAETMLARVGLPGFAPRDVSTLSAGEQQRTVLAALLALEPAVLLLDEPSSQVDPAGLRRLVRLLAALSARGHAVLVADHQLAPFAPLAHRVLALKEGQLVPGRIPASPPASAPPPAPLPDAPPALALDGVGVDADGGRRIVDGATLRVAPGERVHLSGPNGAGKTTLLRAAAGLLRPDRGRVRVAGAAAGAGLPGRVGLLFQRPERNLFEATVGEEVAFSLRRMGWPRARAAARVDEVLERCEVAGLRHRSPLRLSFGEQHRVALASVLAPGPRVLLLDEPLAGLDPEARLSLLALLAREADRGGTAVVLASHDDALPDPGWAHRTVRLAPGGGFRA